MNVFFFSALDRFNYSLMTYDVYNRKVFRFKLKWDIYDELARASTALPDQARPNWAAHCSWICQTGAKNELESFT